MLAPATVSTFRLDKYEVTVGRFRAFVEANQGTQEHPPGVGTGEHPNIPGSGWQASWTQSLTAHKADLIAGLKCDISSQSIATWTDEPGDNENRPVNCLTWYEAAAFCAWDDGYMPTEAEWNYAATGGDEQRVYPWSAPAASTDIDSSRASYQNQSLPTQTCLGDGKPACEVADFVPVGSKPLGDGRWGQSDLIGNVAEWTLDYQHDNYVVPCTDCADLVISAIKIVRGGSVVSPVPELRSGFRNFGNPGTREAVPHTGVRCARTASVTTASR